MLDQRGGGTKTSRRGSAGLSQWRSEDAEGNENRRNNQEKKILKHPKTILGTKLPFFLRLSLSFCTDSTTIFPSTASLPNAAIYYEKFIRAFLRGNSDFVAVLQTLTLTLGYDSKDLTPSSNNLFHIFSSITWVDLNKRWHCEIGGPTWVLLNNYTLRETRRCNRGFHSTLVEGKNKGLWQLELVICQTFGAWSTHFSLGLEITWRSCKACYYFVLRRIQ